MFAFVEDNNGNEVLAYRIWLSSSFVVHKPQAPNIRFAPCSFFFNRQQPNFLCLRWMKILGLYMLSPLPVCLPFCCEMRSQPKPIRASYLSTTRWCLVSAEVVESRSSQRGIQPCMTSRLAFSFSSSMITSAENIRRLKPFITPSGCGLGFLAGKVKPSRRKPIRSFSCLGGWSCRSHSFCLAMPCSGGRDLIAGPRTAGRLPVVGRNGVQ